MTIDKDFKKLVRQRAAKTGESYTTARQVLIEKTRTTPKAEPACAHKVQTEANLAGGHSGRPESKLSEGLNVLRLEDASSPAAEAERLEVETVLEASGQWLARTHVFPELERRGDSSEEARRELLDAIWWKESSWSDHIDAETVDYLNLTDD